MTYEDVTPMISGQNKGEVVEGGALDIQQGLRGLSSVGRRQRRCQFPCFS
jgi:hypothetical protein